MMRRGAPSSCSMNSDTRRSPDRRTSALPPEQPICQPPSIILTTNPAFVEWPRVLGDAKTLAAPLDRPTRHLDIIKTGNASRRLEHRTRATVPPRLASAGKQASPVRYRGKPVPGPTGRPIGRQPQNPFARRSIACSFLGVLHLAATATWLKL
jgi:hypothetical protein